MSQPEPVPQRLDHAPGAARRDGAEARRAAEIEDRKRSFLRMASHELRTPLNSILGFSELIGAELYGPLGAPQYKEYADIIRTSGQRLLRLVNQILEIARLQSDAADLDLQPEAIDHAFDDARDTVKEDLTQRRTQVTLVSRGPLPLVVADARCLRTVLSNLIQNACIFSPEGAQVRVRAERVDLWVVIAVEDDGSGVDPQDLPRLLKPFEQGENALTRRSEGAGLGLPICDLMCTAMGGRLRLRSAPGRGFTALVWLPAA
jgi:signal transduction histidine kinase